MNVDLKSLSHTKWKCEYHIIFTPQLNRRLVYRQHKDSIRDILKTLCISKEVEIIGGYLMPDYIHMLVSIPPKLSVSNFVGYLKGKSSFMIFNQFESLHLRSDNHHFWTEGYLVSTSTISSETINEYVKMQIERQY